MSQGYFGRLGLAWLFAYNPVVSLQNLCKDCCLLSSYCEWIDQNLFARKISKEILDQSKFEAKCFLVKVA